MQIRFVEKNAGRNFFILEIGIHFPSLVAPLKRWAHIQRVELQQRYNRWKYGTYSSSGRGTYVWRDGVWVPGKAHDTSIWHTFFDCGLSRFVDSSRTIRDHEKQGHIYTTFDEAERECAKKQFQKKMEFREKLRKDVSKAWQEVTRNGRSFHREHMARMPQDMRLRAERMMAARTINK